MTLAESMTEDNEKNDKREIEDPQSKGKETIINKNVLSVVFNFENQNSESLVFFLSIFKSKLDFPEKHAKCSACML